MSAASDPGAEPVVRAWQPGEPAVPEVFAARPGARFRPRAGGEWEWAFHQNPAGARLFLARRGEQPLVGFGGLPVRGRAFGGERRFVHLFDPPEASDDHEATTALGRAFLAAHGGPDQDLLHYGWPEARHLEFAKSCLEQELLCADALLVRDLEPGAGEPSAGVEEPARFGSEVDRLYERCSAAWLASTIRDAAFLNWRFADHPFRRYRLLVVRDGQELRGMAVYRAGLAAQRGLGLLVDWLVLPGDEQATTRLLDAASAHARMDGAAALALSLPVWSPWSLALQERGFLHQPSERLLLVRSSVSRLDMLWLRDNWWMTLADDLLL